MDSLIDPKQISESKVIEESRNKASGLCDGDQAFEGDLDQQGSMLEAILESQHASILEHSQVQGSGDKESSGCGLYAGNQGAHEDDGPSNELFKSSFTKRQKRESTFEESSNTKRHAR